ncbi:hypothetical protein GWK47_027269 [Chionoecetes opilio]|uniref:HAT C-terminal dimerisation domain-containing protein n=1 Tax=Chionoecetes opilio TaxID=41210 RepID=A0A8J8W9L3_CHIOP|nr:hypothetical protein GWK47_027269 [Chionoecetes opilio]
MVVSEKLVGTSCVKPEGRRRYGCGRHSSQYSGMRDSLYYASEYLSLFDQIDILMDTAIHPFFKLPVVRLLKGGGSGPIDGEKGGGSGPIDGEKGGASGPIDGKKGVAQAPLMVDALKSRLLFEVIQQAVFETSQGSSPDEDDGDDFFKSLRSPRPTAIEGTNSTRLSNKMRQELESSCSEKQRNKLVEQAMFPDLCRAAWVDVFVKYNTAIPSSAAVERLFSQGSDIMKAKRANLTSNNFARLVLMMGNMDLLNMVLSPEDSE